MKRLRRLGCHIAIAGSLILIASCGKSDQQGTMPPSGNTNWSAPQGTASKEPNSVPEPGKTQATLPNGKEPTANPKEGNVQAALPEFKGGTEGSSRVSVPLHRTALGRQFANVLFYSGSPSMKTAALTFDDGPDVVFTNQILDILKGQGIKATFFIVGERAQRHPEMVQRIVSEGHAIGNHTWDHPNLVKISSDQIKNEVLKTEQLLQSIIGYRTDLFRPPYGSANATVINEVAGLGFKIIDWSVDTRDWAGTPTLQIMDFVRKEMSPGGIVLQHCAGGRNEDLSNTVTALPEIISYLKSNGYSFATIPQLLKVPTGI